MIILFKRVGRPTVLAVWVALCLSACGGGGGGSSDMAAPAMSEEAVSQAPEGKSEATPSQATRYVAGLMAKNPHQADQQEPEDVPVAMSEDDSAEPDTL